MKLLEHCIMPDWPAPKNVGSLQTTRGSGVSSAPYNTFNLGDHVGDDPLFVARNRIMLASLLPGEPVWLQQVHGTAVASADAVNSGSDTLLAKSADCRSRRQAAPLVLDGSTAPPQGGGVIADACVARARGAVCVVMTADCLPVLLCDEAGTVVGAAHAGWRGLCDGVIEATVQAMGVAGPTLMAWLGPAISQRAFEVGGDVRDAFIANDAQAQQAFVPKTNGKWLADIYWLARQRLNALGVTRIYGGDLCTYADAERFYSYRRDGVTGRMGSFIWLD